MSKSAILFGLTCIFVLTGCDKGVDSPKGFSLPKGDPEVGKRVFLKYQCLDCHSIADFHDENIERENEPPIELGSNSAIVKTYAELVTSIINPSHRLSRGAQWATLDENGDSVMPIYNDVLTVSELIDVVSYIQPYYKVTPWPYTVYPNYQIYQEEALKKP
jgi:sulfur-oxidizing protein SoxX